MQNLEHEYTGSFLTHSRQQEPPVAYLEEASESIPTYFDMLCVPELLATAMLLSSGKFGSTDEVDMGEWRQ